MCIKTSYFFHSVSEVVKELCKLRDGVLFAKKSQHFPKKISTPLKNISPRNFSNPTEDFSTPPEISQP